MKRGQIVVLIAAGLIAALVGYVGYGSYQARTAKAATTRVQTTQVRRGSLQAMVSATGNVVPSSQAKLSFKSGGKLKDVYVKYGDTVKQGQTLASLDTSDLQLSLTQAQSALNTNKLKLQQLTASAKPDDVAAAQANYDSAVAKYNQLLAGPNQNDIISAQAALDKAKAALQNAQTAYDRVAWRDDIQSRPEAVTLQQATDDYNSALAAYNQKMAPPTQDQTKTAEAAVHTAKTALDTKTQGPADTDVALAQESIKQAQASYDQAKLNLDNATLKAPYDGVILTVASMPGEQVGAGTAVITIVDPNSLRVDATVDEMDVPKVQPGQDVQYTLDALPGVQLAGKVSTVAPSATIQQGVATYPVSMSIDPASMSQLKGGMSVGVNIVVQQKDNVLLLPNRAVRASGRNRYVEVPLPNGKTEQRQVSVGMSNDQSTEIVSGVQEGEEVVIPTTTTTQSGIGGARPGGGFGGGGGGGVFIGGR